MKRCAALPVTEHLTPLTCIDIKRRLYSSYFASLVPIFQVAVQVGLYLLVPKHVGFVVVRLFFLAQVCGITVAHRLHLHKQARKTQFV